MRKRRRLFAVSDDSRMDLTIVAVIIASCNCVIGTTACKYLLFSCFDFNSRRAQSAFQSTASPLSANKLCRRTRVNNVSEIIVLNKSLSTKRAAL